MNKKIMLLTNDTTYVYNLRREIIQRLISEGYEVVIATKILLKCNELECMGCRLISVDSDRHGTNPLTDIVLLCRYIEVLRKEKPDIVLTYNIKPNVYGGMACRFLNIKYLPNITGLGTAVEYPGKLQWLTTKLYKWGVSRAKCIFFQNEENMHFFKKHKMLPKKSKVVLLPGSGVNLNAHSILPYTPGSVVNFLFVARLLQEKGIDLYLSAAKRIARKYSNVMFHICGQCDDPKYLKLVKEAEAAGYIKYHGEQMDMIPFFQMAHCVVHPSYYPEGMSNVLLEAAASGRPIIATDRSGCRETMDAGVSGYLIPIKNEEALYQALKNFMKLTWSERQSMGMAGREKIEREFDRQIVVEKYMEQIEC